MSAINLSSNRVRARRLAREWSQAELAKRAGISRAAVSAIEGERLSPSVVTALTLAEIFECSVEELFGTSSISQPDDAEWAWKPQANSGRYWEAEVGKRRLLYPVESLAQNPVPHDGVWESGICHERIGAWPERTLTVATCDPAAGLLAAEYARSSGLRLLVFPRSGSRALELLQQGLIHIAALHRSTTSNPGRNAETVRQRLGTGYGLLRVADWQEGVALPSDNSSQGAASVVQQTRCWAGREPGSGARECLDELLEGRPFAGRELRGHASVAEAVRSGWAGAGVCVRLSAEEAGLNFVPVRTESLDFCFRTQLQRDPRIQALIRLLRSRGYRRLISELPGYAAGQTGALNCV